MRLSTTSSVINSKVGVTATGLDPGKPVTSTGRPWSATG